MKRLIYSISLVAIIISFMACEDVVNPTLEKADPMYVVDAWITNAPGPQTIFLTRSQPYFENILPPGVSGATVTIEDSNGKVYTFTPGTEVGRYVWSPAGNEVFGEIGLDYTLTIAINGETLRSNTSMGRVPPIDSITFNKQASNGIIDDLYFAEFWAKDPEEVGDKYWIRTRKNGKFLNKPSDINIAYDAAFKGSEVFSGVIFIQPIRTNINPFDEDENGDFKSPYDLGDSLHVELYSISEEAYDFLTEVQIQTDRPGGFGELFSTPLGNVSSNIENVTATGTKTKVVGFFNVGASSGLGRKFKSYDEVSRVF
jgi:hypothetical protein